MSERCRRRMTYSRRRGEGYYLTSTYPIHRVKAHHKLHFTLPPRNSPKQVDIAVAPGVTVQEILPGHVASISELKSGFLSMHKNDEVTKQFISSGFAFARSNSIFEIFAVEAVIVEQIDPASLQKGLAEFTQKLSTASADA